MSVLSYCEFEYKTENLFELFITHNELDFRKITNDNLENNNAFCTIVDNDNRKISCSTYANPIYIFDAICKKLPNEWLRLSCCSEDEDIYDEETECGKHIFHYYYNENGKAIKEDDI